MGRDSKIEWTDHTFNPWIGCSKVSDGCKHCYAETMMDKRLGKVEWGTQGTRVRTSAANWKQPLKWNREAKAAGVRRRVFCASLADVFEDRPELAKWRSDLFELIGHTPNLDWLLLTKRPENIISMTVWDAPGCKMPANVWIGTSVENQEQANRRVYHLGMVPAKVRFLSMEPLLGPVDLTNVENWTGKYTGDPGCNAIGYGSPYGRSMVDWVIVGGESGPKARPMHPDWVRSIRDQCQVAGVPFFFKQWGEWEPKKTRNVVRDHQLGGLHEYVVAASTDHKDVGSVSWYAFPPDRSSADAKFPDILDIEVMRKTGKHNAGRLLDGREWNEFPGVG